MILKLGGTFQRHQSLESSDFLPYGRLEVVEDCELHPVGFAEVFAIGGRLTLDLAGGADRPGY